MQGQTSKGLRIAILIYAIYFMVWGLLHVISPETLGANDPPIMRILGAAMVAFAFGAGLAYLERAWGRIKIAVLMQIAWMIVYTVTMAWGILAGGIITLAWMPTIIGAVFAILLTALYIREERIKK